MLKLHNTFSKKLELVEFDSDNVKIYLCGPTVQSSPHIGHGRSAVAFDFLVRYLKFLEYKVTFVRNITDIDDKIIERSSSLGLSVSELAKKVLLEFEFSYRQLNCTSPDIEPKATESIENIINIINILYNKGFAYSTTSGVYFEVAKFDNYLELSGRSRSEVVSGTRIDLEEDKKNSEDFALWKISKENEPSWPSPWGSGRPGWHIECSAMINKIFMGGIDIHCGGNDLIFPHHENELAQSTAAFENQNFVKYWLHNGMVNLSGQKMSKSQGNIKLLNEYIEIYSGNVIRFFFLRSHYRKPQEFSEDLLEESKTTFKRILDLGIELTPKPTHAKTLSMFKDSMNDDLNTPKLLGEVFMLLGSINEFKPNEQKKIKETILYIFEILGFDLSTKPQKEIDKEILKKLFSKYEISFLSLEQSMPKLIKLREELRDNKNFDIADQIREEFKKIGIVIQDGKNSGWYRENS